MRTMMRTAAFAAMLALGMNLTDAYAKDKDNNPPGPVGGRGTNWENPPGPEGGRGASPDHNRRHWKEKADTNQDGRIDEAEREAAKAYFEDKREARRERFEAKADTNQDGVVDGSEKEAAKALFKEKRKEMFEKKADTNRDGVVDDTERAQAEAKRAEWKAKADTNQDGRVDRTEKRAAKEHFKQKHDRDDNPPGPRGGKGTNWENKPGPKGGPGAGRD